ncbi:MAG TPA: aminopeptidase P family protein [Steroidobacteraceae bacterium]|jgi:Xaa-Pro aminopeptidase|nr:aminopeptidase P family protein [Steroidobacteraceae bacterium]
MPTFDAAKPSARNAYDADVPPNLLNLMLRSWAPDNRKPPRVIANAAAFAERRRRLSQRFPDELLVIPSGHRKVRANDTYYPFRPGTDFFYLTGVLEPDCVLVLLRRAKGHEPLLFVEPNPGKTDATFFTDRNKGELWEGHRPGVPESEARYAMPCRALPTLASVLHEAGAVTDTPVRIVRGLSASTETLLGAGASDQPRRDAEMAAYLSEMRLIKDAGEVRALQNAVAATRRGFEDVIARLREAKSERELEGVFWTRARMEGNDVGYTSIVASGAHACTLHWKQNDGAIRQGDLLLLDAGIEGRSLYTADVTRTLPISGKFSPEQRAVYGIVLDAQRAALRLVRPGNDFMAPNKAAMAVIARGLAKLGILTVSAEEALRDENQFYRRYSLHNVSHMLGLDVHDCAQARAENYKYGKLEPGMVLTVEPGLYFQTDDLTVPRRYRGIGVRIEDDVLVTAKGHRVLSASLPSEVDEVEAWMRRIWKGRRR